MITALALIVSAALGIGLGGIVLVATVAAFRLAGKPSECPRGEGSPRGTRGAGWVDTWGDA